MTTTRTTIDQLMRKAKGVALKVKGRATGDQRTRARGWLVRRAADARLAARRISGRLRHTAHR